MVESISSYRGGEAKKRIREASDHISIAGLKALPDSQEKPLDSCLIFTVDGRLLVASAAAAEQREGLSSRPDFVLVVHYVAFLCPPDIGDQQCNGRLNIWSGVRINGRMCCGPTRVDLCYCDRRVHVRRLPRETIRRLCFIQYDRYGG